MKKILLALLVFVVVAGLFAAQFVQAASSQNGVAVPPDTPAPASVVAAGLTPTPTPTPRPTVPWHPPPTGDPRDPKDRIPYNYEAAVVAGVRKVLDNIPAERKLVIDEDTVAAQAWASFPHDPEPFAPSKVIIGIVHIPSTSTVTLDRTGKEISRTIRSPGSPWTTDEALAKEGERRINEVLADPELMQRIMALVKD